MSATKIVSIQATSEENNGSQSLTFYQCPSQTECGAPSDLTVAGNSVTGFSNATSAFYPLSNITSGETLNYVITFANGQSISGDLIAE